jgi:tRNA nucleotidyltransferase (CCA-adding enzyme)
MTTDVVTLTPDQTVDDARAKLLEHQLRGAPVIDAESGKLLGLLKLSDLVKAAQGGRGGGKIKGVVRTNVPTVSPGMPFVELEEFIMERGIGRLPVIEDSGKLVGIITRTDILRHHNLYPSLKPRTFPDEAE